MNVFSFDLAVDGQGFGASAHRCPLPWKERIDIAQRVKVGIGSFGLSRSARDLLKKLSLSKVDKKYSRTSSDHVHSRGGIGALGPHYWCNTG